jgi:peptide/nickel transport system ATP-binding protein
LEVDDISVSFSPPGRAPLAAVRGVSFGLKRGETLGIVGESGSGKSVTALSLLRLIDPPGAIDGGKVILDGVDLMTRSERDMRAVRGGRIAWIPQDPLTSLNPVLTIGAQMIETLSTHRSLSAKDAARDAAKWLARVHIPGASDRLRQYPHQLSGGMRQRVMIAMAFALEPEVLIADEPTTALDMTVQAQILDLMDELKAEFGTAVILITHDLGIVAERADRVAVMYGGQIVETAASAELFSSPQHPYTQALLASLPDISRPRTGQPLVFLEGQPPRIPVGSKPSCAFAERCDRRFAACTETEPALLARGRDGSAVRCLLYAENVN